MLVESGARGLTVVAANPAAQKGGIAPGLRFADAKARLPDLASEEIDREADEKALRQLGAWMIRVAPIVALDPPDGLTLEVTGCGRLYGGEAALAQKVAALLKDNGIAARLALASTPGAGVALSRHGGTPVSLLAPGEERDGLSSLPVAALRLSDEASTLLRRFGLTRVGQLYGIDRRALARRFGARSVADSVLLRLDQALGERAEPLVPVIPPPDFRASQSCLEPLITSEAIGYGLESLSAALCDDLKAAGQGARAFTLHAFRADGTKAEVHVSAAAPLSDPAHLCGLFRERLDRIDPGFGIDLLVLHGFRTDPAGADAPPLSGDLAGGAVDIAALCAFADRVTARLGEDVVRVRQSSERHRPEDAERRERFTGTLPSPLSDPSSMRGPRPLRLLDPPERIVALAEIPDGPPRSFRWRRVVRRVVRADGPERIAPEWAHHHRLKSAPAPNGLDRRWLAPKLDPRADAGQIAKTKKALDRAMNDDPSQEEGTLQKNLPRARDYYRVEDPEGRRYWLFRDGLYDDGRGGVPQWYVHGIFA